ncbi:MAG: acylneuraminate cytidylyltransferase family protein [Limnohabitans sp.]|nr:acylneuraminate cytidylyltransferase family protein [Limnohabitans sp.]
MEQTVENWCAVIPLRAGSKGLPNKNTRLLAGKPLYRHSLDLALSCGASQVVITTDIEEILNQSFPSNITLVKRPTHLCADDVAMAPVLLHVIEASACSGTLILMQATSPLRQAQDIKKSLDLYSNQDFDLVMSVTTADNGVLKWGTVKGRQFIPIADPSFCFSNRQSLPPVFKPNGAIYVMNAQWFLKNKSFVTPRIGMIEMPLDRSFDIDTAHDLQHCETLLLS